MDYDQNSGDEARVGLLNRGGADFKSASKKIRVWHCDFFLAPSITENQAFWGGAHSFPPREMCPVADVKGFEQG